MRSQDSTRQQILRRVRKETRLELLLYRRGCEKGSDQRTTAHTHGGSPSTRTSPRRRAKLNNLLGYSFRGDERAEAPRHLDDCDGHDGRRPDGSTKRPYHGRVPLHRGPVWNARGQRHRCDGKSAVAHGKGRFRHRKTPRRSGRGPIRDGNGHVSSQREHLTMS